MSVKRPAYIPQDLWDKGLKWQRVMRLRDAPSASKGEKANATAIAIKLRREIKAELDQLSKKVTIVQFIGLLSGAEGKKKQRKQRANTNTNTKAGMGNNVSVGAAVDVASEFLGSMFGVDKASVPEVSAYAAMKAFKSYRESGKVDFSTIRGTTTANVTVHPPSSGKIKVDVELTFDQYEKLKNDPMALGLLLVPYMK